MNFSILSTNYPCLICYQRLITPISCNQCHQLLCMSHLPYLKNKCPNCRLCPFSYKIDHFTSKLVQIQQKHSQQNLILSGTVFKCLVQQCNFSGKYHQMDIHRRKTHRNQELKNIVFERERRKMVNHKENNEKNDKNKDKDKEKRQMLMKLFVRMVITMKRNDRQRISTNEQRKIG